MTGAGLFIFDDDEVADRSGNSVGEDFGLKAGFGVEFSAIDHPLRTQLEVSYLRLFALREEFGSLRASLLFKF